MIVRPHLAYDFFNPIGGPYMLCLPLNDLEKYLSARAHKARRFFAKVLRTPEMAALIDEAEETRRRWSEDRSGDRTWFQRMHQMESMAFARARAAELWPEE